MVMVKVYNINSIKFGTTERVSNKKLHDNGFRVMNCSYFIRPYEPTPNELGSFLLQEAKDSKKVEMKQQLELTLRALEMEVKTEK